MCKQNVQYTTIIMLQNEVYVIQVVQQYCAQTKICCETCTRHLALLSKTGTKKGEGGKGLVFGSALYI